MKGCSFELHHTSRRLTYANLVPPTRGVKLRKMVRQSRVSLGNALFYLSFTSKDLTFSLCTLQAHLHSCCFQIPTFRHAEIQSQRSKSNFNVKIQSQTSITWRFKFKHSTMRRLKAKYSITPRFKVKVQSQTLQKLRNGT